MLVDPFEHVAAVESLEADTLKKGLRGLAVQIEQDPHALQLLQEKAKEYWDKFFPLVAAKWEEMGSGKETKFVSYCHPSVTLR